MRVRRSARLSVHISLSHDGSIASAVVTISVE